jgi:hypothetical protein
MAGFYLIFARFIPIPWLRHPILRREAWVQATGVAVTAAGLLFAIWARLYLGTNWSGTVTVKVGHELVRSGPYRWVQITTGRAEQLRFPGSAANANCALRTLRRMLHKAEEWKVIGHPPKIKLMKEHGRHLRLDDEAERKLFEGASGCKWRRRTFELFRDVVILMRDTGMRNQRELYRMRIENLDWQRRVNFVPDSKTAEGRRLVPMSRRVVDILRQRCTGREEGWVFPSARAASGHLCSIDRLFRQARSKAGLPKALVLYCARHDYGTRVLMRTEI